MAMGKFFSWSDTSSFYDRNESRIRSDGDRALLYDLDAAIQRLAKDHPGNSSGVQLTGVYHNLLRRWAEM